MNGRSTRPTNGPDRERLAPCVCSTLRMVSRAVTQLYDDVLRPSGLRVTQFSILAAIARLGEANLRQLEHMLAIDQTTLTRSLNLLERARVIERVPHPDGRVKGERSAGGRASAVGPRSRQGAPRVGYDGVGRRATAPGPLASCRRREAEADPGPEPCPAEPRAKRKGPGGAVRKSRGATISAG